MRDVVTPKRVGSIAPQPPFGLLMSDILWSDVGPKLKRKDPEGTVHKVTPDGALLSFEVPTT